jgi:hypothetical protein
MCDIYVGDGEVGGALYQVKSIASAGIIFALDLSAVSMFLVLIALDRGKIENQANRGPHPVGPSMIEEA